MTTFLPAFLIGLAGSMHCLGMCSPLVMMVSKRGNRAVLRNLMYNGGRIMTYGLMGSLISFAGTGLEYIGIQEWVSIFLGIVLLIISLLNLNLRLPLNVNQQLISSTSFLRRVFSSALAKGGIGATFAMGMINGILPCGLTLAALSYCVTLAWPADGLFAMIFFGLGTIPTMAGAAVLIKASITKLRIAYGKIQTSLLVLSAALLIARGSINVYHEHHEEPSIPVCGITPK